MKDSAQINSGQTLGVLGSGQLGRMFCQAARRHGFRTVSWGPPGRSPCSDVADEMIGAEWGDRRALMEFCSKCVAATTELEQVPPDTLNLVQKHLPLRPAAENILICQNRIIEKNWLKAHGFSTTCFAIITSGSELRDAISVTGLPAVLKTAAGGYDGHGQIKIHTPQELQTAWLTLNKNPCVLEKWNDNVREISVITARNSLGQNRCFPVCENIHHNHILALTVMPARISGTICEKATACASQITQAMRNTGILTVEFFLTPDNELLVNELAPRPHNSGHATIDACNYSQFDFQVFTLANHPLPEIKLKTNAVMVNLLGHLWNEASPDFSQITQNDKLKLHLYGKTVARPGRKMGHLTALGTFAEQNLETLQRLAESQAPAVLKSLS